MTERQSLCLFLYFSPLQSLLRTYFVPILLLDKLRDEGTHTDRERDRHLSPEGRQREERDEDGEREKENVESDTVTQLIQSEQVNSLSLCPRFNDSVSKA